MLQNPSAPRVDVLLVTATDLEAEVLGTTFEGYTGSMPRRRYYTDFTAYDLGLIGGASVYHVQCQMGSSGPGASTLTVYDAIERLGPDTIILVGIAFGIDPSRQALGEILVSRRLTPYELQRVGTDGRGGKVIVGRGPRAEAAPVLIDRFRDANLDWQGAPVTFGTLLSGEKLVDNRDYREDLLELEPEAVGGEMEGSGLYAAAHRRQKRWIIVKAICDWADGEKKTQKTKRQAVAARNSVDFVLHALTRGGLARPRSDALGAVALGGPLSLPVLNANGEDLALDSSKIIESLNAGDFFLTYRTTQQFLKSALDRGDKHEAVVHYSNAINILRSQGRLSQARSLLKEALRLTDQVDKQHHLKLLKEALAISQEMGEMGMAAAAVTEIANVDNSGYLHPEHDRWLPGVILWRTAFVKYMRSTTQVRSSIAMCRDAVEWFADINDPNQSGLASAHLNYGWLLYLDDDDACIQHFTTALHLSSMSSPRTRGEAMIALGSADSKFAQNELSAERIIAGARLIRTVGAGSRNYGFLGEQQVVINSTLASMESVLEEIHDVAN